jgi:hypothetical protein
MLPGVTSVHTPVKIPHHDNHDFRVPDKEDIFSEDHFCKY